MGHSFWTPGVYWSPCSCWTAREQCVFFWTKPIYIWWEDSSWLLLFNWEEEVPGNKRMKSERLFHWQEKKKPFLPWNRTRTGEKRIEHEDGYCRKLWRSFLNSFFFFLHKKSRKLFSSVTTPSNFFLEMHFTSQPFSLIIVSISSVLLRSLNYFFRKSVSI